jgi:hypothetical protein
VDGFHLGVLLHLIQHSSPPTLQLPPQKVYNEKTLYIFFSCVNCNQCCEESLESVSLKAINYYVSGHPGIDGQFKSAHVVKFSDADAMWFSDSPGPAHDYLMMKFSTTKKMAANSTCDDAEKSVPHQAIKNQLISS